MLLSGLTPRQEAERALRKIGSPADSRYADDVATLKQVEDAMRNSLGMDPLHIFRTALCSALSNSVLEKLS